MNEICFKLVQDPKTDTIVKKPYIRHEVSLLKPVDKAKADKHKQEEIFFTQTPHDPTSIVKQYRSKLYQTTRGEELAILYSTFDLLEKENQEGEQLPNSLRLIGEVKKLRQEIVDALDGHKFVIADIENPYLKATQIVNKSVNKITSQTIDQEVPNNKFQLYVGKKESDLYHPDRASTLDFAMRGLDQLRRAIIKTCKRKNPRDRLAEIKKQYTMWREVQVEKQKA